MFQASITSTENDRNITGPERKTPKRAINAVVDMAIQEGHNKHTRIALNEDGSLVMTAHGNNPEKARQEAHDMLTRIRRRYR